MQYKGFKRIRRVAAVILSAALIITDLPQAAGVAYASEVTSKEMREEESQSLESSQQQDTQLQEETVEIENESVNDTEIISEETQTEINSEIEPETQTETSSEIETESQTETQTETNSEIETESQTETDSEIETESQTEFISEIETDIITEEIETEIETETIEKESNEQITVPYPVIDKGIYEYEKKDFEVKESINTLTQNVETMSLTEVDGVYTINNKEEFKEFINSGLDYSEKTVNLNCNVDLKNEIVGFNGTFSGTFNGNGHSIINVKTNLGLFKTIDTEAVVKNLHISNAAFTGTTDAGVIAHTSRGTIENCVVAGSLTSAKSMNFTAGIVVNNRGTVKNCLFSGNITATAETDGYGKNIAGIVGLNDGTIENCYATGTISTKAAIVAGIAAENYGIVDNSYNYMDVSGAYTIAGIAAENRGTLSGCKNYGNIKQNKISEEDENEQAGGITAGNTATIEKCYNYGTVTGAGNNVAGIAGYSSKSITESGNYGTVTGTENVAGIVGLYNGTGISDISKSFNKGIISGKGNGIGGILGAADTGNQINISNCYNTGTIQASAEGADYAGGLAGILKTGSISNCYGAGIFSVKTSAENTQAVGSIAGYIGKDVTCMHTYFKEDDLGVMYYQDDGTTESGNRVEGTEYKKTDEELKSDDIIALLGSDYVKDTGNVNSAYPVLNGQTAESYKYPVIYQLNGGCLAKYFDIVDKNATVSVTDIPTKKNAEFKGWFSDDKLTTAVTGAITVTSPVIIYAGWEDYIVVEKIELSQKSVELVVGETFAIPVKCTPENAKNAELVWQSDDSSVATVDETGKVTAVKSGETVILIQLKDNSDVKTVLKFEVKVSTESNIVRIRRVSDNIEIDNLDVAINDPCVVEAVIGGAYDEKTATIEWHSNNATIADVKPDETAVNKSKATIYGVNPGEAIITVTLTPNDSPDAPKIVDMLKVKVCPLATEVNIKLDEKTVTDTAIYDIVTSKFVAVGTTEGNRLETPVAMLGSQVLPSDAGQKVEWISSDESVLKFTDKNKGEVVANSNGTVDITVKTLDGSKKEAKAKIEVKKVVQLLDIIPKETDKTTPVIIDGKDRIQLTTDTKVYLEPKYTPSDATEKKIGWSISNKDALSIEVDENTGKYVATAKSVTKDTEVTATARSLDLGAKGDGVECTVKFIVKPKIEKIFIYRDNDMENPVNDSNIGINPDKDDRTFVLRVKNNPEDALQIVTWSSSDKTIATVEDQKDGSCIVTVKEKEGKSVITATAADGSKVTAKTTVNVTTLVSAIVITGSHTVMKGKSITLKAEVMPVSVKNKDVEWDSIMPEIASVDKHTGKVTGKKAGYAIIRATADDGSGVQATYGVTVTEPIKEFKLIKADASIEPDKAEVLNGKTIGLDPDNDLSQYDLDMYILPETACRTVTWKSSNEKVATVDENGVVTAHALGKATITATSTDGSGKNAKVQLNVATLSTSINITGSHYVGAGKSIQLSAAVGNKDAANKNIIWSSQYNEILEVDEDGNVTAVEGKSSGSSIIKAEAADGSGIYAKHTVHIMGSKDDVDIISYDNLYTVKLDDNEKKYVDIDMSGQEFVDIKLTANLTGGTTADETKDVVWSTSNKNIATVESSIVDGRSVATVSVFDEGNVNITAKTADGYATKDVCTIKVENPYPLVKITGPTQVAKGKKIQLSAGKTKIVKWTSSDESIAKVNSKGKVTAKNTTGKVLITAYVSGGNSGVYEVNVAEKVSKVDIALNDTIVTGKKLGMDIVKDDTMNLTAIVEGGSGVTWKSSKSSVVKVDANGKIEALKAGTAKITATATDGSGKKATVTVTVSKQVTGIQSADVQLSAEGTYDVRVAYNKSVQLKVNYKPLAATTKKVKWEVDSNDKQYVSISSSGKVKAKRRITNEKGYATVTATATDGSGVACTFRIYVTEPSYKVEVVKDGIAYKAKSTLGVDLDVNDATIKLGTKVTDKQETVLDNQRVTWKSSNTKIVKVDNEGNVTGLKTGKATVTATVQDGTNKSCKINIYVGKIATDIILDDELTTNILTKPLKAKKSIELSKYITVRPITATNQKLTYKSSNTKLATVNSKGKVTAKKFSGIEAKTVDITISTTDGSNISKTITVTVIN